MSINDALSKVASHTRTQAQENFEFFANHVCGLHVQPEQAVEVQEHILAGLSLDALYFPYPQHERAARAWAGLNDKGPKLNFPSETFAWIFGELEMAA